MSDLVGAPRGGNGETDSGIAAEQPQFKQKLVLVGDDGVEIEADESDSGLFVKEILRERCRVDCSRGSDGLVKDSVKYRWSSMAHIEIIIFALVWFSDSEALRFSSGKPLVAPMYREERTTLTTTS